MVTEPSRCRIVLVFRRGRQGRSLPDLLIGGEGVSDGSGYRRSRLPFGGMRLAVRNSFRPVLRGELILESDGRVLTGSIRWHPVVQVFSFLWLTGVAVF